MNAKAVTSADVRDDIQRVCYRAIHDAAFNTSDKMIAALVPHLDRYVAAELRAQADSCDEYRGMLRAGSDFADGEQDALSGVVRTLRARADELDPPATRED